MSVRSEAGLAARLSLAFAREDGFRAGMQRNAAPVELILENDGSSGESHFAIIVDGG